MAEITREDAINILEKSWSYHNEINHAHSKAISDMQKLEKIEKILFKCPMCNHSINCEDCMHDLLVEIEQIVKEV